MAGWKTYNIEEAVTDISDQAFVLPVVQRRFIWEPEKIELLFDTVLKGDAFGGIMVLEEDSGKVPLFESRPFARHGETIASLPTSSKLAKRTLFVIDGQQRLQSLYIGLIGRLEEGELFFDLYSDHKTFFDFRFATDARSLPSKVRENDESELRVIRERSWYRVATLFDRIKRAGDSWSAVADNLVDEYGMGDKIKEGAIRANVTAFWTNIFSEARLGVDSVNLNSADDPIRSRQRVVELFRRLNDGGTPLSA